jgi:hypothetical protein
VYWVTADGGAIHSVPIAGGPVTTVATSPTSLPELAGEIAVDGTNVYVTQYGGDGTVDSILSAPVGGGSLQTVYQNSGADVPCGLASDGTSLYFTTAGHGVRRMAHQGGAAPVTLLASSQPEDPCSGLALDASYVYANSLPAPDDGGMTAQILRLPK